MTVASLFKHKMRFTFEHVETGVYDPECFMRTHYFKSSNIENVESIGLNDVNDLHTIICKPLVLYVFSKVVHEDHVVPIDELVITAGVLNFQESDYCNLRHYCFKNPLENPELFFTHAEVDSRSCPEDLFKQPTHIFVEVNCYYYCEPLQKEMRFRREFNFSEYWYKPFSFEEYLEAMNSSNEIAEYLEGLNSSNEIAEYLEALNPRDEIESFEDEFYNPPIEPYTPPVELHREDCCMACLEAKPNILYLNCLHIVICDSCDRLKKTGRKNCDVCRAEILERVKI